MFEVDFKRLIALMLPGMLRRPLVFGLLRAGAVGVERLYAGFRDGRRRRLFRLGHNGQVCYLRGALNEYFGRGFGIADRHSGGRWLHAVTESGSRITQAVSEEARGVPVVYTERMLNAAQNDFDVLVPARFWSRLDEIKAFVESYKLPTKRARYVMVGNTPLFNKHKNTYGK